MDEDDMKTSSTKKKNDKDDKDTTKMDDGAGTNKNATTTSASTTVKEDAPPKTVDSSLDSGTQLDKPTSFETDMSKLNTSLVKEVFNDKISQYKDYNTDLLLAVLPSNVTTINGDIFTIIKSKIPTLFKFVSSHSTAFASTESRESVVGPSPLKEDTLPNFIKASIDLVKDGTTHVRLMFDPENYPINLFERFETNYYAGSIMLQSQTDATTTLEEMSRRLDLFIRLVRSCLMVITDMEKNKLGETTTTNPVYANRTTIWAEDNPHPYFGMIYHKLGWFRDAMQRIIINAPLETNEFDAISDGNHKIEARIGCVTDQFTSSFIRNTKRIIDNNVLTPVFYQTLVQAHAPRGTNIRPQEPLTPLFLKYYNPTVNDWTCTLVRLLFDVNLRNFQISKLSEKIVATKSFEVSDMAPFFSLIATVAGDDYAVIQNIFPSAAGLSLNSFVRLFVLEHFAHLYTIDFTSGTGITFENSFSELTSQLLTYVFFPKLVQAGSASYGMRLMLLLRNLDPIGYGILIERYGHIIQIQPDNTFVRIGDALTALSTNDSHAGRLYSIFHPDIARDVNLPNHIRDISRIFNRDFWPLPAVVLDLKRDANLPYTDTRFAAYSSWNVDTNVVDERYHNRMQGRIETVINIMRNLLNAYQSTNAGSRSMLVSRKGIFSVYIQHLSTIATSVSSLFFTMRRMSDTIMNSYLFVHDGYERRHPMLVPQWLSIGPYTGADNIGASLPNNTKVVIDARVGLTALVSVSGDFSRPIVTNENLQANYTLAEQTKKREINPLNAIELTNDGLSLAREGMRFGTCLAFLEFISSRLRNNDPIYAFSNNFRSFLQMRTFAKILDNLAAVFAVDIRGTLGDIRIASNIGDYRTESLMIAYINRVTLQPETRINTMMGQRLFWVSQTITENINLCSMLALSDYSPANLSSIGLIIASHAAEVLTPHTRPPPADRNIAYNPSETLAYISDVNRQGVVFNLPNNGGVIQITNPRDPRLNSVRLVLNSFGDLAPEHIPFLTEAIMWTTFSIQATRQQYHYDIRYVEDPEHDIYSLTETEALIMKTLSSKTGEYLKVELINTQFALKTKRFSVTKLVWRSVIHTLVNVPTREVITGIYDLSRRPQEFEVDAGDAFGIGPNGTLMPISHIPKISSTANMNNFINVYTNNVQFSGNPKMAITYPGI